jgi:hypothetical protein
LRSVKKPFSGEPKKNGKSLLRLVALKGFSEASGIFSFSAGVFRFLSSEEERSFQSSALASFGSFLR